MIEVTDLLPGDELHCWLRLGLAITPTVTGKGKPYYKVPPRTQIASAGALTSFVGTVQRNNVDEGVLTLTVSRKDSLGNAVARDPAWTADISYTAFRRIRRLSKINYEPHQANLTFPANFVDAAFKPFRKIEEVKLR